MFALRVQEEVSPSCCPLPPLFCEMGHLSNMVIRDIHLKLFAAAMGFIGISLFAVGPFLEVENHPAIEQSDMVKICNVEGREGGWKYIVLHHSATREGNAAKFDAYHRNKKRWRYGLAYHFVIGNGSQSADGEIEVGERWKKQVHGAHTASMDYNHIAIGICLVGNFEEQGGPTERQFESLLRLVTYLCKRYVIPLDNVIGHNQVQQRNTACPGRHFPLDELKARLQSFMQAATA